MSEVKNCLHVNLKKMLDKKAITFDALAASVDVPVSTLKGWCEAPTTPRDLVALYKVAKFFDTSLEEILFAHQPKQFSSFSVNSTGVVIAIEILPK
jgi:hypothetical protein